ncbi:ASCH domain-containing protein [Williamsia sp.]|uniref:ASCH domain-containing protein n=1 Tax=Williamsia sp. TaxID=1872085 RepID=UPI001A1C9159|nr:ASCH domain-containing protein [Williamsia sp.]MBJ7290639.1 ASCH domain-containing protein [Williamsia sp.]
MSLTEDEERYWRAYLAETPDSPGKSQNVIAGHPGSPEIADTLLALYLQGDKVAGSGLVEDYTTTGDPLPQVGDHWIVLDSLGSPRCILLTVRIENHKFLEVPEYIAAAEGEGDMSLAHWRSAHSGRYAAHLRDWGLTQIEDATVITEFFQVVYAKDQAGDHT